MEGQQSWQRKVAVVVLVLLVVPLIAEAQQEERGIPLLLSTGMPTAETPEDVLPTGAVAYLRANNAQRFLENLDSLLTTFVPEKALPAEMQPIFDSPQPFIAFAGMQMFGQPVEVSRLPEIIGLGLDRPVSLALYPMPPDKGFVLSIPVAQPTIMTGMVENFLRPASVEKGAVGSVTYYHVVTSNPDVPPDVYIVASDNTVFLCGSPNVVQMLVNSENMGTLTDDPVMAKGIEKYADRDLTLILSAAFIKPQLPLLQQLGTQSVGPAFEEIRSLVEGMPAAQRLILDSRLRLELGVDGLDQFIDYAEAYVTGASGVLLDALVQFLTNLEGASLALDIDETFQTAALTFFSQDIQPENFTAALPLDDVQQALDALPGGKSSLLATGQCPEKEPSALIAAILEAIETELTNRELPMDSFLALKNYCLSKQPHSTLESKVDWTLTTFVPIFEGTDFEKFETFEDVVRDVIDRLFSKPLLVQMRLMPSMAEGELEQYFAEKAALYRDMHDALPFLRSPWFDRSSRFQQEELGDGLKKLMLEYSYTTRRGIFGYQQHELINRQIFFYQPQEDYDLLYDAVAEASELESLVNQDAYFVPEAVGKLLDQAPPGTTAFSLFRTIQLLARMLDMLVAVEEVIHQDLANFLEDVQDIVETSGEEDIAAQLVEQGAELPLLMASLNLDETGEVYCTLPGGLYFPRPKVMPAVKGLFADFLEAASAIGGSVSFTAVQPGEFELSSVQSTEGLAVLVKTVGNNFYEQYMSSPEGMQLLQDTLLHPADFQALSDEEIFVNPFWVVQGDSFPLLSAIQRSKRSRTAADMRAIGTALGSFLVDMNYYPQHPELTEMWNVDLPPEYYSGSYTDGWGAPFLYVSDESGSQYLLLSYGKDQEPGWGRSEFDADIVYMNGTFIASPLAYGDKESELNAALVQAVAEGVYDFVEVLLEVGADPNATDDEGQSALSLALELGHEEIAELLEDYGAVE
ncbi:hypothetical protein GF339_14655 [candidate division KSB3 bacterium]|uniref:Type II secretion system protein GspG C-terminal domain-containing protein n=1 Tax=candidate division KSB3 bacterium TaxID=2044937 RepID=A0A9D5JX27_9BACT|nr:hypothetical protein [candidate division KSB3 bacterium]MBD3325823.1 hypothetical protein [candidate division KSB3 bacterium]